MKIQFPRKVRLEMDDSRRKFVKGVLALGALAATGGCMQSSEKPARWISGGPDVGSVKSISVILCSL